MNNEEIKRLRAFYSDRHVDVCTYTDVRDMLDTIEELQLEVRELKECLPQ